MKTNKAITYSIVALLFLVLVAIVMSYPVGGTATVTRSLSSGVVPPGGTVTVTLYVDASGAEFYAIDDVYPEGWEVTDPGVGSIQHAGHWKHVIISDATNIQYTYTMTAPTEEGSYTFSGEYMFNGMESTVPIAGQGTIVVST